MSNWNKRFSELAVNVSKWSKDESTQVGAIIVDENRTILSTGYNGIPRGCEDSPQRQIRPQKYFYFEHAEKNAIYNAARTGTKLDGSSIYVTMFPCVDCARAIIQSGIRRIISPEADLSNPNWKESFKYSIELLSEAGIIIEKSE